MVRTSWPTNFPCPAPWYPVEGVYSSGWTVRCMSANMANSAIYPFGVDKWVVSCTKTFASRIYMVARPGECLRVKADTVLFAGNNVWSISERVRGVHEDALYKSTLRLPLILQVVWCVCAYRTVCDLWQVWWRHDDDDGGYTVNYYTDNACCHWHSNISNYIQTDDYWFDGYYLSIVIIYEGKFFLKKYLFERLKCYIFLAES